MVATRNKIREYRNKRGLTQVQLAKIIGVGKLTIRKHELHCRPIHEKYYQMYAKALGVKASTIFDINS